MSALPLWIPYCGVAPTPADWLGRWNLDPVALSLGLVLTAWALRPAAGFDRPRGAAAAVAVLFVLLFVSPLCALSSALFSVRVVHHVLITAAIAPLVVLAWPARARRPFGPLAVWTAAQAAVFWAWHAPDLYAAALSSDAVYALMQASLLGVAIGFWNAVRCAVMPAAAAALLATMVQMGLLGALLTSTSAALYAPHLASTQAWGLTALEDQQLGGLVMWAPAAGFYLAAALVIVGRWLAREARAASAPA